MKLSRLDNLFEVEGVKPKVASFNAKLNGLAFSRTESKLFKSLKFFYGAYQRAYKVAHIELCHFCRLIFTGVGDGARSDNFSVCAHIIC